MTNNFMKWRPVRAYFFNADGWTGRQTGTNLTAIFRKSYGGRKNNYFVQIIFYEFCGHLIKRNDYICVQF
jgi:hypothetical protein